MYAPPRELDSRVRTTVEHDELEHVRIRVGVVRPVLRTVAHVDVPLPAARRDLDRGFVRLGRDLTRFATRLGAHDRAGRLGDTAPPRVERGALTREPQVPVREAGE